MVLALIIFSVSFPLVGGATGAEEWQSNKTIQNSQLALGEVRGIKTSKETENGYEVTLKVKANLIENIPTEIIFVVDTSNDNSNLQDYKKFLT